MASERSLYRKIQIVLDITKSVSAGNLEQLRGEISSQELPTFVSDQYDEEEDRFVPRVSARIIRKTLGACRILGLIGEDGKLTPVGREASRKSRFNAVISEQIRGFLSDRHVSFKMLNQLVLKHLQASPPILPTSDDLWESIKADVPRGTFTRLLTLLAHCGAAESAQRRIYLRFEVP
jgi:hypothetical protein